MRDRRRLARLQWSVAAGVGAVLLAAVLAPLVSAPANVFVPPFVLKPCGRLGLHATAGEFATLALSSLTLLVMLRGAVTGVILARAMHRTTHLEGRPAELHGHPITVLPADRLTAFTAGWLRPRTFVSDAVLRDLDAEQLRAVVEHERHHCQRHDPLRLAARRMISEALFFIPTLGRLRRGHAEIAEVDADAAAARAAGGDVRPLAGALLAFDARASTGEGISPARVDCLLGGPRLPGPSRRDVLVTVVVAAGLVALAFVAVTASGAGDHAFRLCASTLTLLVGVAAIAWKTRLVRPATAGCR